MMCARDGTRAAQTKLAEQLSVSSPNDLNPHTWGSPHTRETVTTALNIYRSESRETSLYTAPSGPRRGETPASSSVWGNREESRPQRPGVPRSAS
eukprot:scaffold67260_cov68-Phaeocystis_antarctica.AAC.2